MKCVKVAKLQNSTVGFSSSRNDRVVLVTFPAVSQFCDRSSGGPRFLYTVIGEGPTIPAFYLHRSFHLPNRFDEGIAVPMKGRM